MVSVFYIASIVAVLASFKTVSTAAPMSALLYLIVSLLASASILFSLDAYFSAILQTLLFVGVMGGLFVATIYFLNLNTTTFKLKEKANLTPKIWLGPLILIFVLFVALLFSVVNTDYRAMSIAKIDMASLSIADVLLGPYILVIELAGFLILGAIVVSYHFVAIIYEHKNVDIFAGNNSKPKNKRKKL